MTILACRSWRGHARVLIFDSDPGGRARRRRKSFPGSANVKQHVQLEALLRTTQLGLGWAEIMTSGHSIPGKGGRPGVRGGPEDDLG
jgi:hypothetical protein